MPLALPDLKGIFKKNKIKCFTYHNKSEIVQILRERNIVSTKPAKQGAASPAVGEQKES